MTHLFLRKIVDTTTLVQHAYPKFGSNRYFNKSAMNRF